MNVRGLGFLLIAGAILLFSTPAIAQTSATSRAITPEAGLATTAPPVFAVASIRPHEGPLHAIAGFSASGPRLTLEGYNLRLLVQEAYNLTNYRVSFAGSNVGSDKQSDTYYNIAAVADGNDSPTRDEFRQMLQALLADRFKLRFHREAKEIPVYALVVAKGGPKFKESAPDEPFHFLGGVHGRNQTITASKLTMEFLADSLGGSFGARLPVIEKTGLTGSYDIRFEATPEYRIDNNPQAEDLSLFDAVQEQLGLKLVRQKASVEVLVVDHIEEPSKN